ncbi:MAG: acetyl/propionyl/methylcrotonyl-CoA carboxylase subunit alpha [Pseudomonadota bacterium]|nr:acetyl/propionyl/methylcrotonyl-CoA carboxylase subunit alpha [Pseudomonadota bacterium]
MFKKILIANRGEIACRVIKTARKMGIKTVAVYSEADDGALHMRMADEAVFIGAAAASQSYLVADRIVQACKATGAEAVHPGYGFLSENQGFARALEAAGIAFIGPGIHAIHAMGDKIESKKLAIKAGVSTVPGHTDVIETVDEAVRIAAEIGFPVMIKASAGGGGKGMRVAWNEKEAREGFQSARNEAASSFADDRVFIEKFIVEPRHIEIQVLADGQGTCLYLGERECSIQRRHQKVIEEAPSPFLDPATRKAMGEQACALANAVSYKSAGTVEFIVDKDRNFYFLEMNTRLQVEHPVTELVTGLDIVEWMIRIANGEKLTLSQDDVKLNGWAIESRIYAEDPYRGFLPSIGRLSRFAPPKESATVRVDTGVVEGSEITMFYDPMIAKLCTYGPDRITAINHMAEALNGFRLEGISHNINFLNAVCAHPRFREGRLSTGFIAEEYPEGFHGAPLDDKALRQLVAVALVVHLRDRVRATEISGKVPHFTPRIGQDWVVSVGERSFKARATAGERATDVHVDNEHMVVESNWRPGRAMFSGTVGSSQMKVMVKTGVEGYHLTWGGTTVELVVRTPRAAALAELMPVKVAPDMSKFLLCPMPGLIMQIHVAVGDEVKAGQTLAVVEAMKMENVLRAEADGVVKEVRAKPGDSLAVDDVILELE